MERCRATTKNKHMLWVGGSGGIELVGQVEPDILKGTQYMREELSVSHQSQDRDASYPQSGRSEREGRVGRLKKPDPKLT